MSRKRKAAPAAADSLFEPTETEAGHAVAALPETPKDDAPSPKREVAVRKRGEPAVNGAEAVPPGGTLALLQTVERLATNRDTNPAIVEMLLKEMRDLRAEQARSTFDAQMAIMQPQLPVITRRGKIEVRAKDGKGERTGAIIQSTSYPKWEDVVDALTPILGQYGFSLQFKTGITEKGLVRVVGILAGHGHREQSEIELQHDSTGSKNSVQAVASSISYGKRQVAGALVNFVSRDEDNDGADGKPVVSGEPLTDDQVQKIVEYARAVGCPGPRLISHLNSKRPAGHPEMEVIGNLPASRFDEAIEALRSYESHRKDREAGAKTGSKP